MVFVPRPGVLFYTHIQSTPSTTWIVEHNLDKTSVAVDAQLNVNGNIVVAIPKDVIIIDNNTVHIVWQIPRSGTARVG